MTVRAAKDTDTTDDSATIEHTVSGGDYQGLAANPVMVTVTDNTPPGQVTGVTVTPAAGSLVVAWTAVSSATGYKVQWKSGDQNYSTTERIHTITSGTTVTDTITGLTGGTEHRVQVTATRTNASSDGTPSDEASGTPRASAPGQVTGVTAVKTNTVGELKLSWTAATNAGGYVVQWKSGNQAYSTTERIHTITSSSTLTDTIPGLTGGTEYTVQVTATRDSADNGQASSGATGTPRAEPPGQVTGVMAEKTSTVGELKVDWTAATNADSYKVQWRLSTETDADYDTTRQHTIPSGSTTTYTIPGLTGATAYTVRVIATRAHASDGTPSDGAPGTPKPQPPGQVTGVMAEKTSTVGELMVDWTAAANADGYLVQWKSGDQNYNMTERIHTIASSSTLTDTITGLTGGTEYTVQVTATRGSADNGQASSGATGTPRAEPPGQVMGVAAAQTSTVGELKVDWTAATNADSYKVQWKLASEAATEYGPTREQTVSGGSAITYTIPGLTGATAYTVRVIATREHASDGTPSDGGAGNAEATAAGAGDGRDGGRDEHRRRAHGELAAGRQRGRLHRAVEVGGTGLQHDGADTHDREQRDADLHDSEPDRGDGVHGTGDRHAHQRRQRAGIERRDRDAAGGSAGTGDGRGGGTDERRRRAHGGLDGGGQRGRLQGAMEIGVRGGDVIRRDPRAAGVGRLDGHRHDSRPDGGNSLHRAGHRHAGARL